MSAAAPTPVVLDNSKKRLAAVVGGVAMIGGAGILVLAWINGWGFLVWFWVGLLTLFGALGFFSTVLRKSQFASAACPACGHTMTFIEPDQHRILQCEGCGAWSQGTKTMFPVTDETVADTPTFTVPVSKDTPIRWVEDEAGEPVCTMCGEPAPMQPTEAIEYSLTLMLGGPGTKTTWSVQAPSCAQHPDALDLVALPEGGAAVAFRSKAYHQQFAALNPPATSSR